MNEGGQALGKWHLAFLNSITLLVVLSLSRRTKRGMRDEA